MRTARPLRDEQRAVAKLSKNVVEQSFDVQFIVLQTHDPIVCKPA